MNNHMTEFENNFIKKIRETRKNWYRLHLIICVLSSVLLIAMESTSFIAIKVMGIFTTSHADYTVRLFILPVVANIFILLVEILSSLTKLTTRVKAYILSFCMLGSAFVCFAAHGVFKSLIFVFIFPILLASIYGDLTHFNIMAVCSIVLELISEFFVFWNPDRVSSLSSPMETVHFFFAVLMQLLIVLVCRASISFDLHKMENLRGSYLENYALLEQMKLDELTGIYNRYALRMAFDEMLDDYKKDDFAGHYYFAMMDVNRFKVVNDRFGHEQGDLVLRRLGEVLDKHLPKGCSFRYGGDEFSILMKCESIEEIVGLCSDLIDDFHVTLKDDEGEFEVKISLGIAEYDPDKTISQLVRAADDMLYRSKDNGGGISY